MNDSLELYFAYQRCEEREKDLKTITALRRGAPYRMLMTTTKRLIAGVLQRQSICIQSLLFETPDTTTTLVQIFMQLSRREYKSLELPLPNYPGHRLAMLNHCMMGVKLAREPFTIAN